MDKIIDQFAKLPIALKAAAVLAVCALIAGSIFFFFIMGSMQKIDERDIQIEENRKQISSLREQAKKLEQLRTEVERLKQRLRDAEELLPKQAEIPKLLRDIEYEAREAGLRLDRFELQPENNQGSFAAVPVRMSVRGSYHELAVFLDKLSKMLRIVNATDITISTPQVDKDRVVITSNFLATTYRFMDSAGAETKDKKKKVSISQ